MNQQRPASFYDSVRSIIIWKLLTNILNIFFIQFSLFYYRNILTKRSWKTSEIRVLILTIFWETRVSNLLQKTRYSKFLMLFFGLFRPQSFPFPQLTDYSFNTLSFESLWPEFLKLSLNKSRLKANITKLHIIIFPIPHTSLLDLDNITPFLIYNFFEHEIELRRMWEVKCPQFECWTRSLGLLTPKITK